MIREIKLSEETEWDKIVTSFEKYDIYYLSGYAKAFEMNGDGRAVLIYYEGLNTKAINVVMKRDLSEYKFFRDELDCNKYFDIITPYGYGGFLIEGNDVNQLTIEYDRYCRDNNIICEFVRFHPLLRNWERVGALYDKVHLGETVFIDTRNRDNIWNSLTSKNRNMIRKAQNAGVEIFWGRDSSIIQPFMELYNKIMKKNNAEGYYFFKEDFYKSILYDLRYNSMWFYASIKNEIVAIAIFLFCNGNMHYHLSASRQEYQKYAPTNLLLYEASMWAASNGYSYVHLGGGIGSKHDSLYKFKKAFNKGLDAEFYIGKKIFDKEMYEKLLGIKIEKDSNFELETNYFPKYRA